MNFLIGIRSADDSPRMDASFLEPCVRRFAKSDPSFFSYILATHYTRIWLSCVRLLGDRPINYVSRKCCMLNIPSTETSGGKMNEVGKLSTIALIASSMSLWWCFLSTNASIPPHLAVKLPITYHLQVQLCIIVRQAPPSSQKTHSSQSHTFHRRSIHNSTICCNRFNKVTAPFGKELKKMVSNPQNCSRQQTP